MRKRMSVAGGLAAAAVTAMSLLSGPTAQAANQAAAPTAPPAGTTTVTGPTCWFGACYDYVYGRQMTDTAGATIRMKIADPEVNPAQTGEHSLQELALQDTARVSTVEIGWTVDPELNGDNKPHLFVYHWVNGQTSCYNGCGFVQTSKTVKPGMTLHAGRAAEFAIRNVHGDWRLYYDNREVGYFPGSLWNGSYTRAQVVTAFGEVAANASDVPSCTDMGNGRQGDAPGASWIADYRLYGAKDKPKFTVSASSPKLYNFGKAQATSFRLGGPGAGTC